MSPMEYSGKKAARVLAAFLLGIGGPLEAQAVDRFATVRGFIQRQIVEGGLPSVTVAVAKDGKILWEEGFGWADRERRVMAGPDTPYSLASISKPITATAVMRLAEQATINLDRPANDYLGGAQITGTAGNPGDATVRRLLSHTAGLPLHYEFFYAGAPFRERSNDEAIVRYGVLAVAPGRAFHYSNLGYGVLDEIITRVAGVSYPDYMRAQVFVPLGMTRSSVHLAPELAQYAATRYDARQRPIPYYDFDHDGGSAICASAHDLVRFGMFHLKNRLADQRAILTDSTIDAMQRVQTPENSETPYGLGWFLQPDDHGFRRVSHGGGMPGVSTMLALFPSENLAVAVLLNAANPTANGLIVEQVVAAVLPRYREALANRRPANSVVSEATPFQPPAELVGEWTGELRTYQGATPVRLAVHRDGDIHVRVGSQPEAVLDGPSFRSGVLTGRLAATIPTEDAARYPHYVTLNLWLRDGILSGSASALTPREPVWYFALSSFVELRRTGSSR